MIIKGIRCLICYDTIYSRARHDFHYCSCGAVFIDGGFDYMRIGYDKKENYEMTEIEVDTTKQILYNDWSRGINKYGTIRVNLGHIA